MSHPSNEDRESFFRELAMKPLAYYHKQDGPKVRTDFINALNVIFNVEDDNKKLIEELVDLIHSASLIFNDVKDESELRGGLPVAHTVYGVALTVNAGTLGFLTALSTASSSIKSIETRVKAIKILIDTLTALNIGQSMDIHWTCPSEQRFTKPDNDSYKEMISYNTGALFNCILDLLHLFRTVEVDNKILSILKELVSNVGYYLHIKDDYINLESSSYHQLNGIGKSLSERKWSFPLIHSKNQDKIQEIYKKEKITLEDKNRIIVILEQEGVFEITRQAMTSLFKVILSLYERVKDTIQLADNTLLEQLKRIEFNEEEHPSYAKNLQFIMVEPFTISNSPVTPYPISDELRKRCNDWSLERFCSDPSLRDSVTLCNLVFPTAKSEEEYFLAFKAMDIGFFLDDLVDRHGLTTDELQNMAEFLKLLTHVDEKALDLLVLLNKEDNEEVRMCMIGYYDLYQDMKRYFTPDQSSRFLNNSVIIISSEKNSKYDLDSYSQIRYIDVGGIFGFTFLEFITGISLSDEMFFHNNDFREALHYAIKCTTLQNDLFSYNKDLLQGYQNYNALFFKDQNSIIEEIKDSYSKFKNKMELMCSLDSYKSLRQHLQNMDKVVTGNLECSIITSRYNSLL